MRTQTKEPFFNSKELNKILPSYLLDEINELQEERSQKNETYTNDIFKKDNKKVRWNYLLLNKLIIK